MRGIILAAGSGSRLSDYNGQLPKSLLEVAGKPIIDHVLEAFSRAGVTELSIVIGYKGDVLKERVGDGSRQGLDIQYVTNPDYHMGNALSLYAARAFAEDGPFLLSMADHMIGPDVLTRLLEKPGWANALAVDFTLLPRQVEEGTKVLVNEDGLVTQMGKGLTVYNGIDAGAFRLTPSIFKAMKALMDEQGPDCELSQGMTRMIHDGSPLQACDISGCFWYDVDTGEDLRFVRETLERRDVPEKRGSLGREREHGHPERRANLPIP